MKTGLIVVGLFFVIVAVIIVLFLAHGGMILTDKKLHPTTTTPTMTPTTTATPRPRDLEFFAEPQNVYYEPELNGRIVAVTGPFEAVTLLSPVRFEYDGRTWLMVRLDGRDPLERGWILITEKKFVVKNDEGNNYALLWQDPIDYFKLSNTAGGMVVGNPVFTTGKTSGKWTEIVSPFKYEYAWIATENIASKVFSIITPTATATPIPTVNPQKVKNALRCNDLTDRNQTNFDVYITFEAEDGRLWHVSNLKECQVPTTMIRNFNIIGISPIDGWVVTKLEIDGKNVQIHEYGFDIPIPAMEPGIHTYQAHLQQYVCELWHCGETLKFIPPVKDFTGTFTLQ